MINVINTVTVYEIDGKDKDIHDEIVLFIRSHWNRQEMVVVQVTGGPRITVSAKDLLIAIENATNINRLP